MNILVITISEYGQECELILNVDSKYSIYYLISLIHSKCCLSDLPDLSKFIHNEKELQKSDLKTTIEGLFGKVEATTLMGYYTEGALSPNLLNEYRSYYNKKNRLQNFKQSIGLTFFNPGVTNIIYEYYKEYPSYVVVNVPHALNIPINSIHLDNELSPKESTNLWSLVISFFYQMLNIQLSSVHPEQLLVRGDALLEANNEFIRPYQDLEAAKAACKKPMLKARDNYLESLANYSLILCLDPKGLLRGLYFNIYYPVYNQFSKYLAFVDLEYLSLKSKYLGDFTARNLQASFANYLLKNFLVENGLFNSHPNFQYARTVELQISSPYSDIAMNYFISSQPEPRFWKKEQHTVDDVIRAALKEDAQGPNRNLILALLKEDNSWFENKAKSEIKWELLEHFEKANLEENQSKLSFCP